MFSDLTKTSTLAFSHSGMGIVHENANCLQGKEIRGTTKTGSTDFSSTPNSQKTIKAHSHVAMACFSHLIVNTAATVTLAGRH